MTAFLVFTYDISDPEAYAKYNPAGMGTIMETLMRHGGEVLAAGPAKAAEGTGKHTHVPLKFPSEEAAQAWLDDPDYAPLRKIRRGATTHNYAWLAPQFTPPGS